MFKCEDERSIERLTGPALKLNYYKKVMRNILKYPLGKLILMVIPSQQEGFGNNETYLLDNLLSPLFTALPESQDRPGTNGLMIIMENMQF